MKKQKALTKKIVTVSLLIALNVVMTRICAISTPIVKIGFGFVPVVLCAILFGPAWAGFAAAAGDFLGAILFPMGAYNPGFTVSAALGGIVLGVLLHRAEVGKIQIGIAVIINCLILSLCLNTFLIGWFYSVPFKVLLISRITQNLVMVPVEFFTIWFLERTPALKHILAYQGAV